ncbi:MAG: hypothetical protein R2909_14950 [Gemmatimonadales bacterium]
MLRGQAPPTPSFCQGDLHEYPDFDIVNCYDCAAALAITASALGTPLGYHFHGPFGYLEYVRPIGRGKCNNPFPLLLGHRLRGRPRRQPDRLRQPRLHQARRSEHHDACMREWVPWWKHSCCSGSALIYGLSFGLTR